MNSIFHFIPDRLLAGLLAVAGLLLAGPAPAALSVSPIFGDDMVLQRDMPLPVFGTARPGESVTVRLEWPGGETRSASSTADSSGNWQVSLAALPAIASTGELSVETSSETIGFSGVQAGEVWLCSGQSNMGYPLRNANGGDAAMAAAPDHNLRLFRMIAGNGPAASGWRLPDPDSAGDFSAVCYWMGLELSQWFARTEADVPIGLIQATHDGTAISHWQHDFGGEADDYEKMVQSIQPFPVKGVAWYQGESNGGDADYAVKLAAMIAEWRVDWGLASLPFGIIQLSDRSGWNWARNGQLLVSDADDNAFLVVIKDLPGGALHPPEKRPVGIRAAIGARGLVYGEAIEYSGPVRDPGVSHIEGSQLVLAWTHLGDGLFTDDGLDPGPFSVAAATGRFKRAQAVIDGDTVRVWSNQVSEPRRVRYAYDGTGNLFNAVSVATAGGTEVLDRLKASEFEIEVSGSGDDSTPPAAPTGLVASPGDGQVLLDWDDSAEADLAGYRLYRSTVSGGPYDPVNAGLIAASTYTDGGRSNGVTYWYVATAEDRAGNESGDSGEASATPIGAGGCTPVSMSVTSQVTWNEPASQGQKTGVAQVTVEDNCGDPVNGASVTGQFSGSFSCGTVDEYCTAVTEQGVATLRSADTAKGKVSVGFCVRAVDKEGLTFVSTGCE
ncbi:hypothetical protein GCM10011348_27670 [Marinobacterium nitratireducens]|uniref:Sialate O-acetylesterase domain-containing protein n=1 Tax=Marinobacterium nitratireducens TaxID=518897 RepID=A0A917ZJB2_9GAMM|nr:sialate O-acetylesterase [Marinobacterium nitratireducens]GGO83572.1 hypothetical protein GCM10011348_27670 [Marinobacterium nitratireducens]